MVVGDRERARASPHFSLDQAPAAAAGLLGGAQGLGHRRSPDATSGFRAFTREAALRINIVSEFTYTLESIIQAGKKKLAVAHLPIETRADAAVAPVRAPPGST